MARQPVDDPLRHLDLTALLAIWAQLPESQQATCAAYRGVGVVDLKMLQEVIGDGIKERRSAPRE